MEDRLRDQFDDVAAAGWPQEAGNADPLAAFDQDSASASATTSARYKLGVADQRGSEVHRR